MALFATNTAKSASPLPEYPASCDENFYDVMRARSWMLASREYETAQEFLTRDDSVLQFTCHDYSFDDDDGDEIVEFEQAVDEYMISNFTGACKDMKDIWTAAQCGDFSDVDFINFTAGEYQGPRSCPSPSTRTDKWDLAVAASSPAAATPAANGGMEAVVSYIDKMTWLSVSSCSSAGSVKTGVEVQTGPSTWVDEEVCLAPGCYFTGSVCN